MAQSLKLGLASVALVMGVLPAGCAPPAPSGASLPISTASPSLIPGNTPAFREEIDLAVIEMNWIESGVDLWTGFGLLENKSGHYISGLQAAFDTGENAGEQNLILNLGIEGLAPEEVTPFRVETSHPISEGEIQLDILSYELEDFPRVEVGTSDITPYTGPGGSEFLVGTLKNMSYGHAYIRGFGLLARDEQGAITGFATHHAGPVHLQPRESSPFVVLLEGQSRETTFEVYSDAVEIDDPGGSLVEVIQGPTLRFTAQGLPFATGLLKNTTQRPHAVTANLFASSGGETFGLAKLESPIPLLPDGQRAFSVDLNSGFFAWGDLDWNDPELSLIIDAYPTNEIAATPGQLGLEIQHFEELGSAMFLRGNVYNPIDVPLHNIWIFGSMRALDGEVLSAGWASGPDVLEHEEDADFVLAMPLPAPYSPISVEFDLQAFGMIDAELE